MLAPGTTLHDKRYLVMSKIGAGGEGVVYQAKDQVLDLPVALKELLSDEEYLRENFWRQARLLAGLHHQALPTVREYFT